MKELTLKANDKNLAAALDFIETELEEAGCPMKARTQIAVAAEEIFVNIAHYAYAPGEGEAAVRVQLSDGAAEITFTDSGVRYDPLDRDDPDIGLSAEERGIGGLGIFLAKKLMDELRYEYRDGQNILTLVKKL